MMIDSKPNPSLKKKATLVLFFLSPITAELLTGSTPPLLFFNPIVFIILVFFYGSAVIIFRELMIRWNKGFASLLLLGAAFGILMEGIAVKSFFDPNWPDLGILGAYGRWLGINWVWAINLTIYHAIISIVVPVALAGLLFPTIRTESWISKKVIYILSVVLLMDVMFNSFILTAYFPPLTYYIAAIVSMAFLIYLAKEIPERYDFHGIKKLPSTKKLWLVGLSWILLNWIIYYVIPYSGIHPLFVILLGLLLFFLLLRYLQKFEWKSDIHALAILSGVLTFPIILAFLQEIFSLNPDGAFGMSFVGIAYIVFLVYLRRKINIDSRL